MSKCTGGRTNHEWYLRSDFNIQCRQCGQIKGSEKVVEKPDPNNFDEYDDQRELEARLAHAKALWDQPPAVKPIKLNEHDAAIVEEGRAHIVNAEPSPVIDLLKAMIEFIDQMTGKTHE